MWKGCELEQAPWQCATVTVPMDYTKPGGEQLSIALNRLPAGVASERIGSLVLNPGGPGGSGITIAYNEAASMPTAIRDRFDIVGFDPRGVGRSTAVKCPDGFDSSADSFQACIKATGDLLKNLGTPNVARDLDMVRRAVGDDKLTYLGYSYGTALGGVYADMFPDRVRALVLDGAVDPKAGAVNSTHDYGDDFYAHQDFERTINVFLQLCDATGKCAAGPDSRTLLDRVESSVRDLPTTFFKGGKALSRTDVDDVVVAAMYSATYWSALAVALSDADNGDASTLAGLSSYLQFGYPADLESEPNFDFANAAIRCADFAGRGSASSACDGFPATAEPLPEITAANSASPVLVVGTKDDPATPGRYAVQMAEALRNAVSIQWEGAGHTAFLASSCITDIVTAYIVDLKVPSNGQSCPFVVGTKTITERADKIFGRSDPNSLVASVESALEAQGDAPAIALCVAKQLVGRQDDRLVVHELIGVETPDLVGLRTMLTRSCEIGG